MKRNVFGNKLPISQSDWFFATFLFTQSPLCPLAPIRAWLGVAWPNLLRSSRASVAIHTPSSSLLETTIVLESLLSLVLTVVPSPQDFVHEVQELHGVHCGHGPWSHLRSSTGAPGHARPFSHWRNLKISLICSIRYNYTSSPFQFHIAGYILPKVPILSTLGRLVCGMVHVP